MSRRKKSSPDWVDKLIDFREEIGEDEYREFWNSLNKVRREKGEGSAAWNKRGQEIIAEIEQEKLVFRAKDFDSLSNAKRAAEIAQSDFGGRIIRRNSKGQFSQRGKTFQVIGAKL